MFMHMTQKTTARAIPILWCHRAWQARVVVRSSEGWPAAAEFRKRRGGFKTRFKTGTGCVRAKEQLNSLRLNSWSPLPSCFIFSKIPWFIETSSL
jgi:hypothetical protein